MLRSHLYPTWQRGETNICPASGYHPKLLRPRIRPWKNLWVNILRSLFAWKWIISVRRMCSKMKLHFVSVQPIKYAFEFGLYWKHDFFQLYKLNVTVSVFVCLLMGTVREKILNIRAEWHSLPGRRYWREFDIICSHCCIITALYV